MAKIFENIFMEIQERIISTCLEAIEDNSINVDKTFIYAFWSESQIFFNVFFKKDKSVLHYEDLGVSENIIVQVFDLGMDDIVEISELYKDHNKIPPNQYKLIYDNQTHSFDSDYSYDDLKKSKDGPLDIFMNWIDEIASDN